MSVVDAHGTLTLMACVLPEHPGYSTLPSVSDVRFARESADAKVQVTLSLCRAARQDTTWGAARREGISKLDHQYYGMRLFMQPACQKLLRSKVYIASRSACLHTTPNIHAQAGSGGEMVADELRLRLKDKELLRLQAFIGGHWVSSKSSSSYEVSLVYLRPSERIGFAAMCRAH